MRDHCKFWDICNYWQTLWSESYGFTELLSFGVIADKNCVQKLFLFSLFYYINYPISQQCKRDKGRFILHNNISKMGVIFNMYIIYKIYSGCRISTMNIKEHASQILVNFETSNYFLHWRNFDENWHGWYHFKIKYIFFWYVDVFWLFSLPLPRTLIPVK